MSTPIFTSKKLEKLILKYLRPKEELVNEGSLGKWNAIVFYLNRKKNWLLINSKTHFSLIIMDIRAKDLPTIQENIHQESFLQLVMEGMDLSQDQVIEIVGDISFFSTDADRKALGHINQILLYIEDLVYGGNFSSIVQINAIINT
ncbi:DUF6933 domain-containing protein [Algoriphagus namhaensis]